MRLSLSYLCGLVCMFLAGSIFIFPALAQDGAILDGTVTVSWGAWLGIVLDHITEILLAVLMFALRKLPLSVYEVITMLRVDQLLGRAVDYGMKTVKGAAEDKTLSLSIANKVVEEAMEYAVLNAPSLVSMISDTLRDKIVARLNIDGDARLLLKK